tara:strand:- start:1063 stop:1692 length:630 start_codon:yes stop_codon:yes gene_type:complete
MREKKINSIKDYYEKTLLKYKDGPKAVNWKNKKSQYLRFEKICEIGNLNNKKILDVGCGLGHLVSYLDHKKKKVDYIGIDVSKEMISKTYKLKNDKRKFYCKDILKIKKSDIKLLKADYVVNCGLFTVKNNISSKEWWVIIQKIIKKMFILSKIGISFNLMKFNVDYKDRHLHYQSIDKLIVFLEKNVSKKIVIKNDNNLWEYTCLVYK